MSELGMTKTILKHNLSEAMKADGLYIDPTPDRPAMVAFLDEVAKEIIAGNEARRQLAEHERLHAELNQILHPNGDGPAAPTLCDLVTFVRADLKRLNAKVLEPQFIKTKGVYKQYPVGGSNHGWIGEYNRGRNDLIDQAGQTAEDIKNRLKKSFGEHTNGFEYFFEVGQLDGILDEAFAIEPIETEPGDDLEIIEVTSIGDEKPSFISRSPFHIRVNGIDLHDEKGREFRDLFFQMVDWRGGLESIKDPADLFADLFNEYGVTLGDSIRIEFFNGITQPIEMSW